jgi:hypothetical protein
MATSHRPLTAGRLEQLRQDLTGREQAVLSTLTTLHAATTSQVARIVFAGSPSADRLARRHLARLVRFGLVRRFPDRSRDRKVGAPGYVYALTAAGWRLHGLVPGSGSLQRSSWRPTTAFMAHRLAISELRARLALAEHNGELAVREYLAEPDSWRSYAGAAGERLVLRPDARVTLVNGAFEIAHFVEIDLDTENRPSTIAAKLKAYVRYELSGAERRLTGLMPGVLFIVPTAQRAKVIARVIAQQTPQARSLFGVAIDDEALDALSDPGEVTP